MGKKYQIIYADPPWSYDFGKTSSRFVGDKYNLMTKEELEKLPVNELADEQAILFLWATFPRIDWALDVMKAWGFKYKTNAFTWVKKNKSGKGLFWGMGYYTRSNAEVCLLGIKGKPLKTVSRKVHSVILEPIGKHSQKPPIVRKKIVELMGDLPRIELFARKENMLFEPKDWKGWDVWGNEVESDIKLKKEG